MKFMMVVFSFILGLAFLPTPAQAQHLYLGEAGARVLQCARFYSSLEAQLLCARGDELRAGQLDRLGMLDDLSSDRLVRTVGGQYGYDGGDYFPSIGSVRGGASGLPTST